MSCQGFEGCPTGPKSLLPHDFYPSMEVDIFETPLFREIFCGNLVQFWNQSISSEVMKFQNKKEVKKKRGKKPTLPYSVSCLFKRDCKTKFHFSIPMKQQSDFMSYMSDSHPPQL